MCLQNRLLAIPSAYVLAITLLLLLRPSYSGATTYDCASSCGTIRNLSYPFRFASDAASCGNKSFELLCENNSAVFLLHSVKHYVLAINYDNFTMRLRKADLQTDNCSTFSDYPDYSFQYDPLYPTSREVAPLFILRCLKPVISPFYLGTSACSKNYLTEIANSSKSSNSSSASSSSSGKNLKGYTYVLLPTMGDYYVSLFGPDDFAADIADSCRVDSKTMTSLEPIDYYHVQNSLLYGFELNWFEECCRHNFSTENRCNLNLTSIQRCLPSVPLGII